MKFIVMSQSNILLTTHIMWVLDCIISSRFLIASFQVRNTIPFFNPNKLKKKFPCNHDNEPLLLQFFRKMYLSFSFMLTHPHLILHIYTRIVWNPLLYGSPTTCLLSWMMQDRYLSCIIWLPWCKKGSIHIRLRFLL